MTELTRLAARLLREHGADFEAAQRAGGWTNHVYLAGDIVLRLAPDEKSDRIRREAALSRCLPKAVGYPEIVDLGVTDGHEWSVTRRVPGENLGDAWERLSWSERAEAVRALWEIARAIHAVEPGSVPVDLPRRTWYSALDPGEALAGAEGLVARGYFTPARGDALAAILRRFFDALPRAEFRLCHGDITMENMMWHAGRVECLMDFEHAAILPPAADVYSFLRFGLQPEDARDAGERAFRETVISLARPAIAGADSAALLLGFAALISQRHMDLWSDDPDEAAPFTEWGPYRSLLSLTDGRGGFLHPLVGEYL